MPAKMRFVGVFVAVLSLALSQACRLAGRRSRGSGAPACLASASRSMYTVRTTEHAPRGSRSSSVVRSGVIDVAARAVAHAFCSGYRAGFKLRYEAVMLVWVSLIFISNINSAFNFYRASVDECTARATSSFPASATRRVVGDHPPALLVLREGGDGCCSRVIVSSFSTRGRAAKRARGLAA